jgi:hypothetical protein
MRKAGYMLELLFDIEDEEVSSFESSVDFNQPHGVTILFMVTAVRTSNTTQI